MPVKLPPSPNVPIQSGEKPSQSTARVEIVASGEGECSQLPHGYGGSFIQSHDDGIGALDVHHRAILGPGQESVNFSKKLNLFRISSWEIWICLRVMVGGEVPLYYRGIQGTAEGGYVIVVHCTSLC
jgi:hypothetical protein